MEKFYEKIISLIKLVIHDDKHYYYLYNQRSCHWENLNILTCYLFYVMEF